MIDALTADGWTITDDPLTFTVGERTILIDLGAERSAGAERVGVVLIAVQVQSVVGRSPVADLQQAVGQFVMYQSVLEAAEPDRTLHLAVPEDAYKGIVTEELGRLRLARSGARLLVFDPAGRRILQWTS